MTSTLPTVAPAPSPSRIPTPDERSFDQSLAIVIGINSYSNGIASLQSAVDDATMVSGLLSGKFGYTVISVLDHDATGKRLRELLEDELPKRVGPNDRVVFYFAGHGVSRQTPEGLEGSLLPVDADFNAPSTMLGMPYLYQAFSALRCRHLLVLLDACFAGAFLGAVTRDGDSDEPLTQQAFDHFLRSPARQVITSTASDERALDSIADVGVLGRRELPEPDGAAATYTRCTSCADSAGCDRAQACANEKQHSPFASALREALEDGEGDQAIKGVKDGVVTATELYLYLSDRQRKIAGEVGHQQTARLAPMRGHGSGEFIFLLTDKPPQLPVAPKANKDNNPWRGLEAYDEEHAPVYFGRERETAEVCARLVDQAFTVITGPSGAGKSSLARAGVIPHLKRTPTDWHVLPVIRPGTAPMAALASAVADRAQRVTPTRAAIMNQFNARCAAHPGARVVLVIDQFEELFSLACTPAERTETLATLDALLRRHPQTFRLVVTMRTDTVPEARRIAFDGRWKNALYTVQPMKRAAMKDVIDKPAAARVLFFEPASLVDTLLDDVADEPGALPLLSFALSEMYLAWVNRVPSDRCITLADYESVGDTQDGGVVGAIRKRADFVYDSFGQPGHDTTPEQQTMRRVMLRLVSTRTSIPTRRRSDAAEREFDDGDEQARVARVTEALADAHLISRGSDAQDGKFIEPSHDALVRRWNRLLDWVREVTAAPFPLAMQHRLAAAAREWESAPAIQKSAFLWSDAEEVKRLKPLIAQNVPWLCRRERKFVAASLSKRRRERALRWTLGAVVAVVLLILVKVDLSRREKIEIARIAGIARRAAALAPEDPRLASLLLESLDSSMVAMADNGTRLTILGTALSLDRGARPDSVLAEGKPIDLATVSDDGNWLAWYLAPDTVVITGLQRSLTRTVRLPSRRPVQDLRLHAATQQMFAVTDSGDVMVASFASEKPVTRFLAHLRDDIRHVSVDLAGARVLVVDGHGGQHLLPVGTRAPTRPSPTESGVHRLRPPVGASRVMRPAAWKPRIRNAARPAPAPDSLATCNVKDATAAEFLWDGGTLAIDGDGTVFRCDMLGRVIGQREVRDSVGFTRVVALSPNRRILAIGNGGNSRVQLIRLDNPALQVEAIGDSLQTITAIAWRPDSRALFATSEFGERVQMEATPAARPDRWIQHPEEVLTAAAYSADGTRILALAERNQRAVVLEQDGTTTTLPGHATALRAVGAMANGRQFVTVAASGAVWRWNAPPLPLLPVDRQRGADDKTDVPAKVVSAAFSPTDRTVAIGLDNGTIFRYAIDTLARRWQLKDTIVPHSAILLRHITAPTEASLALLDYSGDRLVWADSGSPRLLPGDTAELQLPTRPTPDGRFVLHFAGDTAVVSTVARAAPPRRVPVRASVRRLRLWCAALSGNGAVLATCDSNAIVLRRTRDTSVFQRIPMRNAPPVFVMLDSSGTNVAAITRDSAWLWPLKNLMASRRLPLPHAPIIGAALAPDGSRLVIETKDHTVQVQAWSDDKPTLTTPPLHSATDTTENMLRLSRDGRLLFTKSPNADKVAIWNVDGSGTPLRPWTSQIALQYVTLSNDERWMLLANTEGVAWLLPIEPNLALSRLHQRQFCLTAPEREQYLGEGTIIADRRATACARKRKGTK